MIKNVYHNHHKPQAERQQLQLPKHQAELVYPYHLKHLQEYFRSHHKRLSRQDCLHHQQQQGNLYYQLHQHQAADRFQYLQRQEAAEIYLNRLKHQQKSYAVLNPLMLMTTLDLVRNLSLQIWMTTSKTKKASPNIPISRIASPSLI